MNDAYKTLLLAALFLGLGASSATAGVEVVRATPDTNGRTVGLGVMLGDPTALTMKSMLSGHHALQIHAGWRIGPADGGRLTVATDYLYQFVVVDPGAPQGQLSPYVGIGGKVSVGDDATILGPRVPLGLSWFFSDAPLELGLEVAPGLTVLPATGAAIDGGLQARYYF